MLRNFLKIFMKNLEEMLFFCAGVLEICTEQRHMNPNIFHLVSL
jgi:hypothetical protein